MVNLSLVLFAGTLGVVPTNPSHPAPVITGIFPPGITCRSRTTWTLTGAYLKKVTSVIASGTGLSFERLRIDPSGRSLTVEVEARADAIPGYLAIRVDGPHGISNLAIVRVDRLVQVIEAEPNDLAPAPGQTLDVGMAVAGVIRTLDVDRFKVQGKPGQRVTLDWETRRLGTAIIPVLTVTGPGRVAITQARSLPGGDRDCRTPVVIPAAGWFEVELRDNISGGDDRARYRLRVDPEPHAWTLLDRSPFDTPGWLEVLEPPNHPSGQPWAVAGAASGVTINGRIDRPGQIDRFQVEARAGNRFRVRVEAARTGSWLDSVLTVLGPHGERLGENDDRKPRTPLELPDTIDGSASTDSELNVTIREDGPITVEVADRSDAGGPEYSYRLDLGPPCNDFSIHLLRTENSTDPGPEARWLADPLKLDHQEGAGKPGAFGVFNLQPGSSTLVPFVIVPRGRPGTIDVDVIGLPPQIHCERVTVRTSPAPRPGSGVSAEWDAPAETHALRFHVKSDASPWMGDIRIAARSRTSPVTRVSVAREADCVVGVDAAGGPERPVIWRLTSFPTRILTVD